MGKPGKGKRIFFWTEGRIHSRTEQSSRPAVGWRLDWIVEHDSGLSSEHHARPPDHDSELDLPPGGKGKGSRVESRRQVCAQESHGLR